uniref:Uncharacterized protein n=1 Tax=uncultured Armatimonadetes bacterium TaxID=157466 RepID=A0A6J4HJH5_9BACT|nr:hypothetical protein AVDCRST_MAG63-768 [uncultured Armatimonadetes bacterium]
MSLALWDEPLSDEEREALLDRIAGAVVGRGLEAPAVMALEIHRPFSFLASQGLIVFGPLLGPLAGIERMQNASRLLREPGVVEVLIRRIEDMAQARDERRQKTSPAGGG